MAHRETQAIATYLKNGCLCVGQFVVERRDLDFGDDRGSEAHALARYERAQPIGSSCWMQARFTAAYHAAADKQAALREMRAALDRLKLAA